MILRIFRSACLVAALVFVTLPAQAAIKVLATTADWAALAAELGGDKVDVYRATSALQDVHTVEAKPSLVARARTADLLVANGAELEIGWRLRRDAWGQGFAREAAAASLSWGWANFADHRIAAWTVPANIGSWGLMLRLGMVHRPELDFNHPRFAPDHPLYRHLVYTIDRPE